MFRVAHSQPPGKSAHYYLPPRAGSLSCSSRHAEGAPYRFKEREAPDRLLQERRDARLERALAHVVVAVGCQDDYRDPPAGVGEMSQETKPTHPRHSQIEDETTGPLQRARL